MQNLHATPLASPAPRIVAGLPPEAAFGRACAHLMTRPAFARAPFGHVARSLAGQVNRGHYAFVQRGAQVVGFAGWALATESFAEGWIADRRPLADAEAGAGDCVVLNFWQADDAEAMRLLVRHLTAALPFARRVYAKRHYPDGRLRPVRLELRRTQGSPSLVRESRVQSVNP